MHTIRLRVRENRLSSSARVTEQDYAQYVSAGAAWVAEVGEKIVGFAATDQEIVWALFVCPSAESNGVGRLLHQRLIGWAKTLHLDHLKLTTATGTRAEGFYHHLGWAALGADTDGSTRFIWRVDQTDT